MVCKECGKEITDESLGYCPECLAPLNEPVIENMSKDDIKKANKNLEKKEKEIQKKVVNDTVKIKPVKNLGLEKEYEGPFIDLTGYVKSVGTNMTNLFALIGAVCLYLSPFATWMWESLFKVKKKADLFDLGGKNGDLFLQAPVITGMAVILLLSGFFMMLMSAREYVKPVWKFRYNFIARFIPVITATVAFLIVFFNKKYSKSIDSKEAFKKTAVSIGQADKYSYGRGIGPILCLLGIAIYFVSVLIDFLSYTKNKKAQQ